MRVVLSDKESEEFFFNALCNGLDYFCRGYGFTIDVDDDHYNQAKEDYKADHPNASPCIEDVYMQVIRLGLPLIFVDEEGDGDNTVKLTMKMIHKRVQKTPFKHLSDMINENDDADTADAIIQTVLFNEIIYG